MKEFFHKAKHLLRDIDFSSPQNLKKWSSDDHSMNSNFTEKKKLIHEALCGIFSMKILEKIIMMLFYLLKKDSINTPLVMKELSSLITLTNTYMSDANRKHNLMIIKSIASYITNLLKV